MEEKKLLLEVPQYDDQLELFVEKDKKKLKKEKQIDGDYVKPEQP